ncbi:MAG: metal-dependent transcriptional regulator, partial [Nitrospinae bacterium]|nr:metal-dependent transcriptional regulator [Nitrospinota bacterium]
MGVQAHHSEKDELLELLWHLDESHDLSIDSLRAHDRNGVFEAALKDFSSNGVLRFDGAAIELTREGRTAAANIVRRHRLAERLMVDVLGKEPEETEQAACEFEHILAPELVESICILLGHPHTCPHGSPIPEGECCKNARNTVESLIMTLADMKEGQTAKVAALNTTSESRLHKLLAMGIAPGAMIKLHQ